jgi:fructokinase
MFENNQPVKMLPGGSVFNAMVSLSRANIPTCFISEVGQDRTGAYILDFMKQNGMETQHVSSRPDGTTALSLAFLNEKSDADYLFYRNYPQQRLDCVLPSIEADDIFIFGSYYSLNPAIRTQMLDLLTLAQERKAIIYYDPNFRSSHAHEKLRLQAAIIENIEAADIIRGSSDDFYTMYELNTVDAVFNEKIRFFGKELIYTKGKEGVSLRASGLQKEYPAEAVNAVSTVGAGDNFNAGVLYALIANNVKRNDIKNMHEETWDIIIHTAIEFATETCRSLENYIPVDFAQKYHRIFNR